MSQNAEEPSASSGEKTVAFADKYTVSPQFDDLFREGMTLVEDAAQYLDGPGRRASKDLTGAVGLAYSTESMRLTSKLMQIASWLLVRRSVGRGEMTLEEALKSRQRAKLTYPANPQRSNGFDELPAELQRLVDECDALYDRILRLDKLISQSNDRAPSAADNPVGSQVERLKEAFQPGEVPSPSIARAKPSDRR